MAHHYPAFGARGEAEAAPGRPVGRDEQPCVVPGMDETLEVWPGEAAGKVRATSGVQLDNAVNGGTRRRTPAESARPMPAGRTEVWMDTAVHVLLYRFTCGIADSIAALGAKASGVVARRTEWYEELTKQTGRR